MATSGETVASYIDVTSPIYCYTRLFVSKGMRGDRDDELHPGPEPAVPAGGEPPGRLPLRGAHLTLCRGFSHVRVPVLY